MAAPAKASEGPAEKASVPPAAKRPATAARSPSSNSALVVQRRGAQAPPTRPSKSGAEADRMLAHLRATIPELRGLPLGGIRGNRLHIGGRPYALLPSRVIEAPQTISTVLGEGVFVLQPTPDVNFGISSLAAGEAYEVLAVDPGGIRTATRVRVITDEPLPNASGVLIYCRPMRLESEIPIEARVPADTTALAQRLMVAISNPLTRKGAPGNVVIVVMANLEERDLTDDEVMEILRLLDQSGMLTAFFELHPDHRLRDYLRRKHVPWEFVYSHWESGLNDSLAVFAGFLFGAGESFYDFVHLIYTLTGSIFSKELAAERDKFFTALGQLFSHPLVTSQKGVAELVKSFEEKLWRLEFFEAGRTVGYIVASLVTLGLGAKGVVQGATQIAKAAPAVAEALTETVRAGTRATTSALKPYVAAAAIGMARTQASALGQVGPRAFMTAASTGGPGLPAAVAPVAEVAAAAPAAIETAAAAAPAVVETATAAAPAVVETAAAATPAVVETAAAAAPTAATTVSAAPSALIPATAGAARVVQATTAVANQAQPVTAPAEPNKTGTSTGVGSPAVSSIPLLGREGWSPDAEAQRKAIELAGSASGVSYSSTRTQQKKAHSAAAPAAEVKTNVSGYLNSTQQITRLLEIAAAIGHPLRPHTFDQEFAGQFFLSHAEKKMSLSSDDIGVSIPMCPDCIQFFSRLAKFHGREFHVSDNRVMRTFGPNGQIIERSLFRKKPKPDAP